jgi:hypothetical protein
MIPINLIKIKYRKEGSYNPTPEPGPHYNSLTEAVCDLLTMVQHGCETISNWFNGKKLSEKEKSDKLFSDVINAAKHRETDKII